MPRSNSNQPNNACVNWIFTLNNPTQQEKQRLIQYAEKECKIFRAQEERGKEEETTHIQGFLQLKKKQRFNQVRRGLSESGRRCHVERCKDVKASWIYCSKEGEGGRIKDGWQHQVGEAPIGKGKRSDLEDIAKGLLGGESTRLLARRYPSQFIRYGRGKRNFLDTNTTD